MASIFQSLPLLRRAAPRLSKQFFTCRAPLKATARPTRPIGRLPPAPARAFRSTAVDNQQSTPMGSGLKDTMVASPLRSLSYTIGMGKHISPITTTAAAPKKPFFPEISDKTVAYWLLGSAASVFGIVVFGGLTRLTESGLSITEWRPVTGSIPPLNAAAWDSEFAKYRSSPEFALLNPHMTLPEFQSIYYMEWTHRLWGRLIGLTFVLPAVYLIARRRVSAPMSVRLGGIAVLIGIQGAVGWWMVKSGLKDDLFAPGSHPRVSQYRLAAHLGAAFVCYSAMLWNGLAILRTHALLADPAAAARTLAALRNPRLRPFQRGVAALAGLVLATALSGALVAGLDAGLIYNEFPHMGAGWLPPRSELLADFYARRADGADRWWRNALENPVLVQLDHRALATTTLAAVLGLFAYARWHPAMRRALPRACLRGMHGVLGFACLQVGLGIATLLYLVPVPVASAHQAGSLALLSWVLVLGGRAWVPGRAARLVAARLAAMEKGGRARMAGQVGAGSMARG